MLLFTDHEAAEINNGLTRPHCDANLSLDLEHEYYAV